MSRPAETVVVCRKCKDSERLQRFLADQDGIRIELVRCQKICHGPVAGTVLDGRWEWFERLHGPKSLHALVTAAKTAGADGLPKRLRRRRVAARAGKLRE